MQLSGHELILVQIDHCIGITWDNNWPAPHPSRIKPRTSFLRASKLRARPCPSTSIESLVLRSTPSTRPNRWTMSSGTTPAISWISLLVIGVGGEVETESRCADCKYVIERRRSPFEVLIKVEMTWESVTVTMKKKREKKSPLPQVKHPRILAGKYTLFENGSMCRPKVWNETLNSERLVAQWFYVENRHIRPLKG